MTSGLRTPSPRLDQSATSSSRGSAVPCVSAPPTASTNGSAAGSSRPLPESPSLPAAATTTMPAFQACSTAKASGARS